MDLTEKIIQQQGNKAAAFVADIATQVQNAHPSDALLDLINRAKQQGTQSAPLITELLTIMNEYYSEQEIESILAIAVQQGNQSGKIMPDIKRIIDSESPTPVENNYMYFEAVEANSTVLLKSKLQTAPNLEYSTDRETWQEWQHTTAEGIHIFDALTLSNIGDRIYLRGDNPNGFADALNQTLSNFSMTGKINAGGNIMSLLDKTMALTVVPAVGFAGLFSDLETGSPNTALLTTPDMTSITSVGFYGCAVMYGICTSLTTAADMPILTSIGEYGCSSMYIGCTSLTAAADMPALTNISSGGIVSIYESCVFDMSSDGTTFNFDFGVTPPVTVGDDTYNTYYDLAEWMDNTNGFTNP